MKRAVLLLLLPAAAAVAIVVVRPGALADRAERAVESELSGVESPTYRVDAIFDTAKGVLPGQVVKIAGARVGTVEGVTLTRDYKARIQMRVDRRFAGFRSDARCAIQPEGLIGERFVQCDPGTAVGQPLAASDGEAPTVPVERTAVPVGLTDLFQIFSAPVRDRIPLVMATLGMGLAGRGGDLNDVLRRANPALEQTGRVLELLRRQRGRLAATVDSTDRVLAELAPRRDRVQTFIEEAAAVTRQTASRRTDLAEAIRRLPPLLDVAQPSLQRLEELADRATPLLADLRASGPGLERLLARATPFAEAATPTVRSLRRIAPGARRTVRSATPVVGQLRDFSARALPVGSELERLVVDLRDRGVVEQLLTAVYRLSATVGRFDSVSHLFPIVLLGSYAGGCSLTQTTPDPDCDARYGRPAAPSRGRAAEPPPADPAAAVDDLLDYLLK